jgi:hypothetical protein
MSSDEESAQLMAAFKSAGTRNVAPPPVQQSVHTVSDSGSEHSLGNEEVRSQPQASSGTRRALCVRVKPANRKDEFVYYEPIEEEVVEIMRAYPGRKMLYDVRMSDNTIKQVSEFSKGSPAGDSWSSKGSVVEAFTIGTAIYITCRISPSPLPLPA